MKILDVGQCGVDGPRIKQMLTQRLKAQVDQASTAEDADAFLAKGKYDLILVNRVFAADGDSGNEFIATHADKTNGTPIMLVSDMEDAQEKAVASGTVRGFGKAELDSPETLELIRSSTKSPS